MQAKGYMKTAIDMDGKISTETILFGGPLEYCHALRVVNRRNSEAGAHIKFYIPLDMIVDE